MHKTPPRSWRSAGGALAIAVGLLPLLTGCEAPLNLEAVRQISEQPSKRTDFYQSMARNDQVIVVTGNDGVLLTSRDDGETWKRQPLNSTASFLALDVCPDNSFVALTFDNQVWHGNAQGNRWTPHSLPSQEQMMTVSCSPDGSWWAAGSFTTIQYSSDLGESWNETSLYEDAIINNLHFINQDQAIATGEYGMVLSSNDGGLNWDYAGYLPDEFYAHTSHFRSMDEGWVGGLNGFIYHTTDGGESWEQMPTETNAPVFGFIAGNSELYAIADNATVLQLQGTAWKKISESDQPLYLRTGLLIPEHKLLVAGGRGLLFDLELPTAIAASKD